MVQREVTSQVRNLADRVWEWEVWVACPPLIAEDGTPTPQIRKFLLQSKQRMEWEDIERVTAELDRQIRGL